MDIEDSNTYHLEPGFIYVSSSGDVIRAVLGSCVTICLWDSKKRVGGACLFIFANRKKEEKRTAKFGDVAIPHLIKLLVKRGAKINNLKAQIYGGGSLLKESVKKPRKTVKISRKILKHNNIEIISEDIGGSMGRKILFNTSSGHTAVLKVHETREDDWF